MKKADEQIKKYFGDVSKKWTNDKAAIERFEKWDRALSIACYFKDFIATSINLEKPGSVTIDQIIKKLKSKRGKRVKSLWDRTPAPFVKSYTTEVTP